MNDLIILQRRELIKKIGKIINLQPKSGLALTKSQVIELWRRFSSQQIEADWIDKPTSYYRDKLQTFFNVSEEEKDEGEYPLTKDMLILILKKLGE